jgi:hypothetical protein
VGNVRDGGKVPAYDVAMQQQSRTLAANAYVPPSPAAVTYSNRQVHTFPESVYDLGMRDGGSREPPSLIPDTGADASALASGSSPPSRIVLAPVPPARPTVQASVSPSKNPVVANLSPSQKSYDPTFGGIYPALSTPSPAKAAAPLDRYSLIPSPSSVKAAALLDTASLNTPKQWRPASSMPDSVKMKLKLGLDFSEAGQEGTHARKAFEQALRLDLAGASGANPGAACALTACLCVCDCDTERKRERERVVFARACAPSCLSFSLSLFDSGNLNRIQLAFKLRRSVPAA